MDRWCLSDGRIDVLEHGVQWFPNIWRDKDFIHRKHHIQLHLIHERIITSWSWAIQASPNIKNQQKVNIDLIISR